MLWVGLNGKEGRVPDEPLPLVDECTCALCLAVAGVGEIRCVAELDSPPQQKWTRPMTGSSVGAAGEMEWNDEFFL